MKLYLAGPMRGVPEFNFPAFFTTQESLEEHGHTVFNPAARDTKVYGTNISAGNSSGCEAQAEKDHGFSIRDALGADTEWICAEAEGIAVLPMWYHSGGARAEVALSLALGLGAYYYDPDAVIGHPSEGLVEILNPNRVMAWGLLSDDS